MAKLQITKKQAACAIFHQLASVIGWLMKWETTRNTLKRLSSTGQMFALWARSAMKFKCIERKRLLSLHASVGLQWTTNTLSAGKCALLVCSHQSIASKRGEFLEAKDLFAQRRFYSARCAHCCPLLFATACLPFVCKTSVWQWADERNLPPQTILIISCTGWHSLCPRWRRNWRVSMWIKCSVLNAKAARDIAFQSRKFIKILRDSEVQRYIREELMTRQNPNA